MIGREVFFHVRTHGYEVPKDGFDGVSLVPDATGQDVLICHYSRRAGLADELAHGIAAYEAWDGEARHSQ